MGFVKKSSSTRAHLVGALAVVKHRGVKSFSSGISHGLLLCVRRQLVSFLLMQAYSTFF